MPSEKDLNKARAIMDAIAEANARGSGVEIMRRRNIVDDSERSVIIDAENKVAQVFPFVCVSAAKELEPTGGFVVIHAHKRYFGTPING